MAKACQGPPLTHPKRSGPFPDRPTPLARPTLRRAQTQSLLGPGGGGRSVVRTPHAPSTPSSSACHRTPFTSPSRPDRPLAGRLRGSTTHVACCSDRGSRTSRACCRRRLPYDYATVPYAADRAADLHDLTPPTEIKAATGREDDGCCYANPSREQVHCLPPTGTEILDRPAGTTTPDDALTRLLHARGSALSVDGLSTGTDGRSPHHDPATFSEGYPTL